MNDRDILQGTIDELKTYARHPSRPMSPVLISALLDFIEHNVEWNAQRETEAEARKLIDKIVAKAMPSPLGDGAYWYSWVDEHGQPHSRSIRREEMFGDLKIEIFGAAGGGGIDKPAVDTAHQGVYWRCEHYPSAIGNWHRREQCEHGCHNYPSTWWSNGFSVKP